MMRRQIFLSLILAILIFGYGQGISYAASYTFTPPDNDMYDLDHWEAYLWGIGQALSPGEVITSASMQFDNIDNWRVEPNILYVSLYDSDAAIGITTFSDSSGGFIDYFEDTGTSLFTWSDTNTPPGPEDYTYNFTSSQITMLNEAIQDGNTGFGFDPDCHFYNDGITYQFETAVTPEPATLALLGMGLFGIGAIRRKRKA